MASEHSMRIEQDLLGEIRVPATAAYGAQTQRAIENFPGPTQRTIGQFPLLARGLLHVKQAAATANSRAGQLDPPIGEAILAACRTLLEEKHYDHFPIHHLHGGGGTSANMNANEVLANLAEERLGGNQGEYRLVHPNDHVNLNQSTNDVYPTACHVAVVLQWPTLKRGLTILRDQFAAKAEQWRLQNCASGQARIRQDFGLCWIGHFRKKRKNG